MAGAACQRTQGEAEQTDIVHITTHLLLSFTFAGLTVSATRAASVNASLTPLFLIAEHSDLC